MNTQALDIVKVVGIVAVVIVLGFFLFGKKNTGDKAQVYSGSSTITNADVGTKIIGPAIPVSSTGGERGPAGEIGPARPHP